VKTKLLDDLEENGKHISQSNIKVYCLLLVKLQPCDKRCPVHH